MKQQRLEQRDAFRLAQIRELIRDAKTANAEDVLAIALHALRVEFPNAGLSDRVDQTFSVDPRPKRNGTQTARNPKSKAAKANGGCSSNQNANKTPNYTGRCRRLGIEFKLPGNKLSPEQETFFQMAERQGNPCLVCFSYREAINAMIVFFRLELP